MYASERLKFRQSTSWGAFETVKCSVGEVEVISTASDATAVIQGVVEFKCRFQICMDSIHSEEAATPPNCISHVKITYAEASGLVECNILTYRSHPI